MSDVKLSKVWQQEYVPEAEDTDLGRIDEAMIVITQIKKRRMKMIKDIEKRADVSENQKIFIAQEYDLWRQLKVLTDQVDANIKYTLGRLPPAPKDLEESVVGAIVLGSTIVLRIVAGTFDDPTRPPVYAEEDRPPLEKVRGFLSPDHFADDRLKRVYRACLAIKGPVDLRTVADQLRRQGDVEAIGGTVYLGEITAKVSSSANIEYHARVVVEHAMRRALIQGASFVIENAYEDGRDVFGLIGYAKKALTKIEGWIK